MTVEVRTPTDAEVQEVLSHRYEAWMEKPAVWRSRDIQALFRDGKPVAIWGVAPVAALSDAAWIWVYSGKLKGLEKSLLKYARTYVKYQSTQFSRLMATVLKDSEVSKRWTAWLGFVVDHELERVYISSKHQVMRYNG